MQKRPAVIAQELLKGLLVLSVLTGCTTLSPHPGHATGHHAFISYWPAPEDGRLRLAVKDLIDMQGQVTTAGSEYFAKNGKPALHDARCLAGARQAHVRIVGKTNLTEFAMGASGMNGYFGTPKNPLHDGGHFIAGGSSSGSAVAVASGMADVAFGTDTAGSVRVPAACCGVLGLKTTFGLVSLQGVFPISVKHLDTVGPMAKDVPRLVEGMELLQAGFGARYAQAQADKPLPANVRIGRLYLDGTAPEIDAAIDEALRSRGFRIVTLGPEFKARWKQAQEDGQVIAVADGWRSDRKYLDLPGIELNTKAVLQLGRFQPESTYAQALARRAAWQRTLRRTLKTVDLIALPTLQQTPPKVPFFGRSVVLEAQMLALQNTVGVNFAGNPALALPLHTAGRQHWPVSLELVGPALGEAQLLNAARMLEARP